MFAWNSTDGQNSKPVLLVPPKHIAEDGFFETDFDKVPCMWIHQVHFTDSLKYDTLVVFGAVISRLIFITGTMTGYW